MALTLTNYIRTVFGNKVVTVCDCAFSTAYPTGGESLSASNMGLAKIEFLEAAPKGGYVFDYDYTNSKVKAYWNPAVSAGTGGAAAGALAEVTNNTDLSTACANVKVFAFGFGRA